jgi:hypothetical protein
MNTFKKLLSGAIAFFLIAPCWSIGEEAEQRGKARSDSAEMTQQLRKEAMTFRQKAENSPKLLSSILNELAEINERIASQCDKKAEYMRRGNPVNVERVQREINKLWEQKGKVMQDAQKEFHKQAKIERDNGRQEVRPNEDKKTLARADKLSLPQPKKVEANIATQHEEQPTETVKKTTDSEGWHAYE